MGICGRLAPAVCSANANIRWVSVFHARFAAGPEEVLVVCLLLGWMLFALLFVLQPLATAHPRLFACHAVFEARGSVANVHPYITQACFVGFVLLCKVHAVA